MYRKIGADIELQGFYLLIAFLDNLHFRNVYYLSTGHFTSQVRPSVPVSAFLLEDLSH